MPAFESRRVRTQPRTSTFVSGAIEPSSAFFTLMTCMTSSRKVSRNAELAAPWPEDKSHEHPPVPSSPLQAGKPTHRGKDKRRPGGWDRANRPLPMRSLFQRKEIADLIHDTEASGGLKRALGTG